MTSTDRHGHATAGRPSSSGRAVDAGAASTLELSYKQLVRAGEGSVRAAWRFGQTIDSLMDAYTKAELADSLGVSSGTLGRYHRLFGVYQRPELAVEASERLQTYNIDLIWALQAQDMPVERGRPMAGRRFRYRCHTCQGTEVGREEITDPEELAALDRQAQAMAGAN
jgi:hypothetical protein